MNGHTQSGIYDLAQTPSGEIITMNTDTSSAYQGVQRPGKPGNIREFRCKEKNSGKGQESFYKTQGQSGNVV